MTVQRRRLGLLVVAAIVVIAAVVLVVRALGGGDEPPPNTAVTLVPETALVYAHVSTDGERDATQRAAKLLGRFGTWATQRDAILQRLSGGDRPVDAEKDVEPWLGGEAALALIDEGTGTAGSLVVVAVTDEAKARAFLGRNPRRPTVREYKGERISQYGTINVAFKDGFMLVGQDRSVQAGLDRANGRGRSLDETPAFRRATRDLPAGRVADLYASSDGLRRLLVPQGGVIGTLASLFDRRALEATGVAVQAVDGGARVTVRSTLDPRRRPPAPRPFDPELTDAVPADALAYLGVNGISDALTRLVTTAAGGAQAGGIGPILDRLREQLDKESGGRLERDLLDLLRREVAVVVTPATPAPILSLITKTTDEGSTRETLRRLQEPLARLLTPPGEQAPTWRAEDFGGSTRGATLATPAGASLSYAVFEGRLVLATSPEGVRRIKGVKTPLSDAQSFDDVLADRPDRVGSLGFLDFSQLLELGEQTGLNDSRAYLAARDDLQKIRAVGVHSTGSEDETTAEILLSIP